MDDLPSEIGDAYIAGNGGITMRSDTTVTRTITSVGGFIPIEPPAHLAAGWRMFSGGPRVDGCICSQLAVYDESGHRTDLYRFDDGKFTRLEVS